MSKSLFKKCHFEPQAGNQFGGRDIVGFGDDVSDLLVKAGAGGQDLLDLVSQG